MSAVITVSTTAELYGALNKATGGETILLAEGDYGTLSLWVGCGIDVTFPSNVTIASADPNKPASFSGMNLVKVENLTLDSVIFDYTFGEGDTGTTRPFSVRASTNVSIIDSVFEGDVASGRGVAADGYGTGIGLTIRDSNGIVLEGNEFSSWYRGLTVANTKDVSVVGNELYDMRSDGMNFVDAQGVLIESNYIHDFRLSDESNDHPDMIQFWTTGTIEPSADIIIRNNILDIGDGEWTQSIFMRNEMVDSGQAGTGMYYQNVLIENNTIYNSHLHGITVGATNGLIIRDNSVLHVADTSLASGGTSAVNVPTIRVAANSDNVSISGNVTAGITGYSTQSDWSVRGNAFVQSTDPHGIGYYGDVFIDSTVMAKTGPHNFIVKPGSLIDNLGAGSTTIQYSEAAKLGDALFTIVAVPGDAASRLFDAGATALALSAALPASSYLWTFSDGSTATGISVTHTFPAGGHYDATLTVVLPKGSPLSATSTLTLRGSEVIAFDSDSGAFRASSSGIETLLNPLTGLQDGAIQLLRTGTAASTSASTVSALRGSDDFEINLTLQADTVGTSGEVFRIHGAFVAQVSTNGQFTLSVFSSDGKTYALKGATALPVNDGNAHDISIRVVDGSMKLTIDGTVAGTANFSGTLPTSGLQGLTFGNPWGKVNFLGDVEAFSINIDVDDYPGVPEAVAVVAPEAVAVVEVAAPLPPEDPLHGKDWDGFVLDIAGLAGTKALVDNAKVSSDGGTAHIVLDGEKDYVKVGLLAEHDRSSKIGFSVDFTRDADAIAGDRLVWNHLRLGLTVNEDSLMIQVATADNGLKAYTVKDLDISDDTLHRATVLVDTEADRLQVIYDNEVILDVTGTDFEMPDGYQYGWMLGTPWNRHYDGEIHDFRVGNDFVFVDTASAGVTA